MKKYYSLSESLSDAGAALLSRDLKAEYQTGKISRVDYLHLTQEKRITENRREVHLFIRRFERIPDEGLL